MGSFNTKCAVSGLSITPRCAVRAFLLTQNPWKEYRSESYGSWIPRSWPVRAKYEDYGRITDWETCANYEATEKLLEMDDPNFDGRVFNVEGRIIPSYSQFARGKGLPTRRDVEALLEGEEDVVDLEEMFTGCVRVSLGENTDVNRITLKLLKYATVISAGISEGNDIYCFPLPQEGNYMPMEHKRSEIVQALIREDVWLNLLDEMKVGKYKEEAEKTLRNRLYPRLSYNKKGTAHWLLSRNSIESMTGLASHASYLRDNKKVDALFIETVAQFSCIWDVLKSVNYEFRPSHPEPRETNDQDFKNFWQKLLK